MDYEGRAYCGWQAQRGRASVQATIEAALSKVAGAAVTVHGAGRTDAGVHALAQVAHFDSGASRASRAWLLGGNSNLPPDVAIRWVRRVDPAFHARHSAVARRYRYVVYNDPARSALLGGRTAWVTAPLNAESMNQAAQLLLGERDFSAFRAAECQSRTPMRCVLSARVIRRGAFVVLDISANAFLHHMVRNIMGTLIEIGQGRHPPEWVAELLVGLDRTKSGPTAAACGLYFVGPEYPDPCGLPVPPEPWFPA